MSTAVKKKLCWNCEGNVSRQADNCPYCGVYLHRENDDADYEEDDDPEDLTPPYHPQPLSQEENTIPSAPYLAQDSVQETPQIAETYIQKAAEPLLNLTGGWKTVVLPLVFLLSGSVLLLFGTILSLFSQDGVLTLQWNGEYWFVYLLTSLPLLYLGWKTLQNVTDEV